MLLFFFFSFRLNLFSVCFFFILLFLFRLFLRLDILRRVFTFIVILFVLQHVYSPLVIQLCFFFFIQNFFFFTLKIKKRKRKNKKMAKNIAITFSEFVAHLMSVGGFIKFFFWVHFDRQRGDDWENKRNDPEGIKIFFFFILYFFIFPLQNQKSRETKVGLVNAATIPRPPVLRTSNILPLVRRDVKVLGLVKRPTCIKAPLVFVSSKRLSRKHVSFQNEENKKK